MQLETPHHMITINASHEGFAAARDTEKDKEDEEVLLLQELFGENAELDSKMKPILAEVLKQSRGK